MKVMVTGGAGLLGAAVVRQLLAEGAERPVVLDIAAAPERLREVEDRVDYRQQDLAAESEVENIMAATRPEVVFHLGAMLGQTCEDDPKGAMAVNVNATFNLLAAACRHGARQLVFASSVATFGYDLPDNVLRDDSLQRPISFYGVTKLFGEGAGLFFRRKHGLDFRSLRYPFIVGPGVREGGVIDYPTAMITASLAGKPYTANVPPETRIHVLHVADAARALLELAAAQRERIRTVNYLVDGVRPALSAGEIAALVKERLPEARIAFRPDENLLPILEKVALPIDDRRAREEWGWEPRYDYAAIFADFAAVAGGDGKAGKP
ncbi:MAG: SDR family NAD(P)-dependent oxidoreductase [Deltaproteobacteria bacterium]|nr:SDR family NAD(P)-dependent oxidoreductase [Deltaproteobacteria bacterium]